MMTMMTSRKTALLVLFLLGTLHTVASFSRNVGGNNLKGAQGSRQLKKKKGDGKKKKAPKGRNCDIRKLYFLSITPRLGLICVYWWFSPRGRRMKKNSRLPHPCTKSHIRFCVLVLDVLSACLYLLYGIVAEAKKDKVKFKCTAKGGDEPDSTMGGSGDGSSDPVGGDEPDSTTGGGGGGGGSVPEEQEEPAGTVGQVAPTTAPAAQTAPLTRTEVVVQGEETIIDEINFEMKFDGTNGMTVTIEYSDTPVVDVAGNSSSTTEIKTSFNITFDKVIEYQKQQDSTAGTGEAYDWENDKVVQDFPLLSFSTFGEVQDDGIVAKVSTSTLPSPIGQVIFTFTVSRGGGENDTDSLNIPSSNRVKIDFELVNYAWAQNDTYVALLSTIMSQRQVAITTGSGSKTTRDVSIQFDDILDTSETGVFGAYTWASDAVAIDGTNAAANSTNTTTPTEDVPGFSGTSANTTVLPSGAVKLQVVATSPADATMPGAEQVAFSFIGEGAKSSPDIYWDPEAGVDYASSAFSRHPSWTTMVASSSLVLSACIVAMTLLGLVL
jgi:hypothetical protein